MPFKTFLGNRDIPLTLFRTGIQDQDGFLWFGTAFDGGIARFDGYDWVFHYSDPNDSSTISSNHILEMYFSSAGEMIVTTWNGVNVVDINTMDVTTFRHNPKDSLSIPHNNPQPVLEISKDSFWIGTPNGLCLLDIRSGRCRNYKLLPEKHGAYNGNFVIWIIRDRLDNSRIWIASDSGLHLLEEKSGRIVRIPPPEMLLELPTWKLALNEIIQDEKGVLWMTWAEGPGGIVTYDTRQDAWSAYPFPWERAERFDSRVGRVFNGLSPGFGDTLYFSSVFGNGYFLKSTGIYSLFPYEENNPELNSAGWTAHILADRHGRLWWPGYAGIAVSERPLTNSIPLTQKPDVHITTMVVDSVKYLFPPFPELIFHDRKNSLTLKFAIPNPLRPADVRYSYMLESRDKNWTEMTGSNMVEYSDLPPGKYQFKVKANEGTGWTEEKVIPILVRLPIWKQSFFPFILLGGILAILGLGYTLNDKYRTRRDQKLLIDLKSQIDLIQLASLRAQMNPHFLFNSLNSIKYYALSKDRKQTAEYLSKFALLVRAILENSQSHTISLNEELHALRLYIEIEHLRLEERFDYQIDVDSSLMVQQVKIPPMILQPFVENAIWHGLMHRAEKGSLLVQIKDLGPQIQCIIEDNGIGREKSSRIQDRSSRHKESLGVKITTDRIALINKIFDIHTKVSILDLQDDQGRACGTRVIITIPRLSVEDEEQE